MLVSDDGRYLFDYNSGVERISLATGVKEPPEVISVVLSDGAPPAVFARTTSQAYRHPITLPAGEYLGGYTTGMVQSWGDALSKNRLLVLTRPSQAGNLWAVTEVHFDERTVNPNRSWLLKLPKEGWPQAALLSERSKVVNVWVAEPGGLAKYRASLERAGSYLKRVSLVPFQGGDSSVSNPSGIMLNTYDPVSKALALQGPHGSTLTVDDRGKVLRHVPHRPSETTIEGVWDASATDSKVPGGKSKYVPLASSANRHYWLVRDRSSGDIKLFRL